MATRQYLANIQPLEKMSLVGNVTNNWRMFKRNFLNNSIVSRLEGGRYWISDFSSLATIRQEVFDIYDSLEFDNVENKMDLEIVMKKIGRFFSWAKRTRRSSRKNLTNENKYQQKILKHT